MGSAERIVVIDWSMIGDLVMLSPCVRAIRKSFPDAHLAILGQPASIEVYKHDPGVNELIKYDRSHGDFNYGSFMATCRELRDQRFDRGFVFHNSMGSALMAYIGRVRERVGYRFEWRDLLLTKRYKMPRTRQHLIETKADLLRQYGIEVDDLAEEVHINKPAAKAWLMEKLGPNFGRSRPIVAVSLGSTRTYKQWLGSGLSDLLKRFPVNSCDFVFLGGPGDKALFEGVYSYNNTVVDLVGQTTIEELSWVLDRADLFIGPDSGATHIAVGRGTPVVSLFGSTDPAICGPYKYAKAEIVRSFNLCPDCEKAHGKSIRQCLHMIDVNEVFNAAVKLLDNHCGININ